MKELIEKLISRLEELKYQYGKQSLAHNDANKTYEFVGREQTTGLIIEIVNQLTEEYINTSTDTSSGWIPCSERLPNIEGNTSDTVLVCTIDGFQHMAFWCDDEKWRYCESGMIKNPMEWTVIIAWQPLPKPYKEGK